MTFELFASPTLTAHEQIGFELGWDYAHHGVDLPAPYGQESSPLQHGTLAGRAVFGRRTLDASPHVRRWLHLRLHAWLRGRSVETVQVTPNYLRQIETTHCPVLRVPLQTHTASSADPSIDRVRNDAGYAAGNLAMMSAKANHAKGAHDFKGALERVRQIESSRLTGIEGLTAAQWSRVAALCSFVEHLPHAEAAAVPLLVLPPNRLRLLNPIQALQAFVSRQPLQPNWSHRVARLEALMPGKPAQRAFQAFFHALLPRVLEAGRLHQPHQARWAIEDAWRHPLVLQRWMAFANLLTAQQCESIIATATAKHLGTTAVAQWNDALATDGRQLSSKGYVPHAQLMKRSTRPMAHQQAALPI